MTGFSLLDRCLAVRQAEGARQASSGHLVYITDTLGVPTPWVIEPGSAAPDPLVWDTARTTRVVCSPTEPWVVLMRDEAGTERHQLWAVHLETREVRRLSRDDGAIHEFGAFFPDGKRFCATATARNGRDFDLYLGSLDETGLQPVAVAGQDGWTGSWRALAVWPDGHSLLLAEQVSSSQQRLWRLWLETPAARLEQLTPPDSQAGYHSAVLLGTRVLAASDWGSEFARLVELRGDGRVQVLQDVGADVESVAADGGERWAFAVNRGGYSEIWTGDARSGRSAPILQGHFVASDLSFSPDGRSLLYAAASPENPPDVWRLNVSDGRSERITRSHRAGLEAERLIRPEPVEIESFDGVTIPAWFYRPVETGRPLPALLAVHGGPEAQERPSFNALYQYWLARGLAILAPNVRGSTGYGRHYAHLDDVGRREDAIRDLGRVAAWLRDRPDIDPDRVAVYGGSYGGYMVLAGVTWFPDLFAAGVEIVGIADLESFLERTGPWRRALREAEYGSLEHDRAVLRELSPIHRVDLIKTPLFVAHGRNDPRVPFAEAEQIVTALKGRSLPVTYWPMEAEGHGAVHHANRRALYHAIDRFLTEHLALDGRTERT